MLCCCDPSGWCITFVFMFLQVQQAGNEPERGSRREWSVGKTGSQKASGHAKANEEQEEGRGADAAPRPIKIMQLKGDWFQAFMWSRGRWGTNSCHSGCW